MLLLEIVNLRCSATWVCILEEKSSIELKNSISLMPSVFPYVRILIIGEELKCLWEYLNKSPNSRGFTVEEAT